MLFFSLSLSLIYLYFLIPAVFVHFFKPTTELPIPVRIPSKESKAGIETQPVTSEIKISK